MCKRFGHKNTYVGCLYAIYCTLLVSAFSIAFSDKLGLCSLVCLAVLSGFFALQGFVNSKFTTPDQMQRFTSVQWIMNYFLGMMIGPMYARQFDAFAGTYVTRSWPNLLSL